MNKYIFCILFLLATTGIVVSCSKSDSSASTGTNPTDTLPKAGTTAQTDTLRVAAYNILNYGDECQGTTANLNPYFQTILKYMQPDIISCEKMSETDPSSGTILNSADVLMSGVFNAAYPGKYNYATYTNASQGDAISVLFYNQQKLGYLKTETLNAYITDFDLYKLFYKDVNLAITKDTTFLYVVVCHTKSGSLSLDRDVQDSSIIASLRSKFSTFPNLIIMGDLNTTGSYEKGYQSFITYSDSNRVMSDPPYFPDHKFTYPGNWSTSPAMVAPCLTTTTRSLPYQPNSCGTSGGGKGWYDHILISPWLIKGTNYMKYISNSYLSVGNDGQRTGSSINSPLNNSAPADVINALFQFSDKYPIMMELEVKANRSGSSPKDPGN